MTATRTPHPAKINELATLIADNQRLVQQLNTAPHSLAATRKIVSQITQQPIDSSNEIRLPFYTDYGRNIHLGNNVFINSGVTFTDMDGIYLADDVLIGPNATLISVNHPLAADQCHGVELKPVHIHHNAWIGANATILPGVTVGENAVVAAGAVVSRNVPANTVVAGVPARVIKTIDK